METLALYDRDGHLLDQVLERGSGLPTAPEGTYWRVCEAWIVNAKGDILIQRRALTKPNWPGAWCESAGGAIRAGETPEEGCIRETMEEIGVKLDFEHGGLAFVYTGKTAHHDVWVFRMDVPLESLTLQPEEVIDAKYASPDEIRRLDREGQFVRHPYLRQLLDVMPILLSAY